MTIRNLANLVRQNHNKMNERLSRSSCIHCTYSFRKLENKADGGGRW